jgi:hypothetical protein
MFPEKIIFFLNFFENAEEKIRETLESLKITESFIIKQEESNGKKAI